MTGTTPDVTDAKPVSASETRSEDGAPKTGARNFNLRNLAIAKRIWSLVAIAAAGVVILGGTTAFFLSQLHGSQAKQERFGQVEEQNAGLEISALQMRRSEKDFLLRNQPKYRDKYLRAAAEGKAKVEKLQQIPDTTPVKDALGDISAGLAAHTAQFETVFGLQKQL